MNVFPLNVISLRTETNVLISDCEDEMLMKWTTVLALISGCRCLGEKSYLVTDVQC
jgi:hypothetical protein